jgi:hypothetical protein
MPLESTECMFKSTEHRYGHVNFMPITLQFFDLLFLVGDILRSPPPLLARYCSPVGYRYRAEPGIRPVILHKRVAETKKSPGGPGLKDFQ